MTDPNEDLERAAGDLSRNIGVLNESIRQAMDLRDELAELTRRSVFNTRMISFVAAGFILDVVLTISMIFFGVQQVHNTEVLSDVVKTQQNSALCPLYKLFIDSDTQLNRDNAARRGDDMEVRARQFIVIRESYAALKCIS